MNQAYTYALFLLGAITASSCEKTALNSIQEPLVIVGSSAAGTAAIKTLIKEKYNGKVFWVSDQSPEINPYYTVELPYLFENRKSIDDMSIFDIHSLPANIMPLLGKRVVDVNPKKNSITLNDGQSIPFSKLLLAIGMSYKPPVEFAHQNSQGVFTFGNYSDIKAIKDYLHQKSVKNVAVVGFGLVAADVMNGLVRERAHITTHVLVRGNRLLDRYCDEEGSNIVQKTLEDHHVKIHTSTHVTSILHDSNNCVRGVELSNGATLDCQMIIFATGPVIQKALFSNAGIKTAGGGVCANTMLQTNQKNIFVAGDGVLIKNFTTGDARPSCKWTDAQMQGSIAAKNMLGKHEEFSGSCFPLKISFLKTKIVSCGPIAHAPVNAQKLTRREGNRYASILYQDGKIKGFLLVNAKNRALIFTLKRYIESNKTVSMQEAENLLNEAFSVSSLENTFGLIKKAFLQKS